MSDVRTVLLADLVVGLITMVILGPVLHVAAGWPWVWALLAAFVLGFGGCCGVLVFLGGEW